MKIPIDWLKEFVKFDDSPNKLAEKLTLIGFEVEGIEDGVLDIEVTPNRPYGLSVMGIAREVAAIYNKKIKNQKSKIKINELNLPLTVEILNPEVSPIYIYRIITGIKVSPSPAEIKKRLNQCGIRDLTSVIDITNYVMLETGQPLHAFDYDSIKGHIMSVRRGRQGETVKTLDGGVWDVDHDAIVIEDEKDLIDLAGVMGGLLSEFKQDTKTIVLQAAMFDPVLIRRTTKRLGLVTEASYRYERGIDWQGAKFALDRASELILKYAGGKAGKEVLIENRKYESNIIEFNARQVIKFLDVDIAEQKIIQILSKLGFEKKADKIIVPSWRKADCVIWQDLAEEVGRFVNYNKFPIKRLNKEKAKEINKDFIIEQKIKDILVKYGFQEVYSHPYCSKAELEILEFDPKSSLKIANPLSPDTQYLRPALTLSLLMQVSKNPWTDDLKIFEVGHIFPDLKDEMVQVGIAYTGKSEPYLEEQIEKIAEKFGLKKEDLIYEIIKIPIEDLKYFKIKRQITLALLDFDSIKSSAKLENTSFNQKISDTKYKKISKYPPSIRDIAFIVDKKVDSAEIISDIKSYDSNILIVGLFDEFVSDKFGKSKKNLAFHIIMQDVNKTLNENDIEKIMQKIIQKISTKYSANIRDF